MSPRDMLIMVVKSIVSHPDDVDVQVIDKGDHYAYRLLVHPDDRRGIVTTDAYQALSTIMKAAGGSVNRRIEIDIPITSGV